MKKIHTSVVMTVQIVDGHGHFYFPQTLRQENIYGTTISCHSVKSYSHFGQPFILCSNASYFQDKNQDFHPNVLRMFDSDRKTIQFPSKIINVLTCNPDVIEIQVKQAVSSRLVDHEAYAGTLIIELRGYQDI